MKVLALDYGTKRTGLALGDTEAGLAFPRGVISGLGDQELINRLIDIIKREGVEQVVVGEPTGLSGQDSSQTLSSRTFSDKLGQTLSVPVVLYDERLTSRQADLAQNQGSRYERDELAALFLLQSYLDSYQIKK